MASTSKTKKTKGSSPRFVEILWSMVNNEDEIKKCGKYISWNESGTGIVIESRNELASHVLPTYFNTREFSSFHRQLTNYGFKKLQDVEGDEFVNENFIRGFPELRKNIIKKKPPDKHKKGSSARGESLKTNHPSQNSSTCTSLLHNPQDPAASEQLTAKRPQENEPFNQKLKKLRASEVRSTDPDSRTPLRSLGTASAVERVSDQANYSLQKEGESQELVIRNTEEIGHSKPGSQETRNGTVSSAPHSLLEELVDNGLMGYSTPEQNYLSNVSNATPMMQLNQSFHPGNTDMGGDLSKHDGFVPFPGPSDISSPTFLLDVSQQPLGVRAQVAQPMEIVNQSSHQDINPISRSNSKVSSDDSGQIVWSPSFDGYLENDALDSDPDWLLSLDFEGSDPSAVTPTSELTASSSYSSFDSIPSVASFNVGIQGQMNDDQNQKPEPLKALHPQVPHGNSSDSGLGSHSSSSGPQSTDMSENENNTVVDHAIIEIFPDVVGLRGAPSCEFPGLAERFPEVQSGYYTVEGVKEEFCWEKGDKDGKGDCIPPSKEEGEKTVIIWSLSREKMGEAKLLYVDRRKHKKEEHLKTYVRKVTQQIEDLAISLRDQADQSEIDGTQHSEIFGSARKVQALRLLIHKAAQCGFQWGSFPLSEFAIMMHDLKNAAINLEKITDRFARDIAPESTERISCSELLEVFDAPHEHGDASEDESHQLEGSEGSDSSYFGDVESLTSDSSQPTSDSEDDLSELFSKVSVKENEIQIEENIAEKDGCEIIYQPSDDFLVTQFGEKETQETHIRLNESIVSVKENFNKYRMSDKQVTSFSGHIVHLGSKGNFSRSLFVIKRREKPSKNVLEKHYNFQANTHFDPDLVNLPKMKGVHQPLISSLLTINVNTECINRYFSTKDERWKIQLHLQRFSGIMATSSLPVLLQEMQLEPEEGTSSFSLTKPAFKGGNTIAQALESLDSDGGLSSPSEKTSAARLKEFDRLLPNYLSRASDVVILTSIYRPTKRILLSFVADREDVFPSDSWFKDEDCELLMEIWNWQRCRLNLVTDKVKRIQEQPGGEDHGLPTPSSNKTQPPGSCILFENFTNDQQYLESEEIQNPVPDKLVFRSKASKISNDTQPPGRCNVHLMPDKWTLRSKDSFEEDETQLKTDAFKKYSDEKADWSSPDLKSLVGFRCCVCCSVDEIIEIIHKFSLSAMLRRVAEVGEGHEDGNGVYGIIRDLIVEGKDARFVNRKGRYVVNWSRALDCFTDYKAKKNPQFKSKAVSRRKISNGLRSALLNYYKKEGANEYKDAKKVNENDEVVERQFQMPPRLFKSMFRGAGPTITEDSEEDDREDTSSLPSSEGDDKPEVSLSTSTSDTGFDEFMDMSSHEIVEPLESSLSVAGNFLTNLGLDVIKTEGEETSVELSDVQLPPASQMFDPSMLDSAIEEICSDGISDDISDEGIDLFVAAQVPGEVAVTVVTDAGKKLGMTCFRYIDEMREMVRQIVKDPTLQSLWFAMWSQEQSFFGNDSNIAQVLGPIDLQGQDSSVQTKQQQSVKVLQLLVYTAAQTDAREFIEMVFSTSAGPIVFNSYTDRTPLPEDVAQANGHKELAQYFKDINTRLSKGTFEDVQSCAIDWLELVKAVQKQSSQDESAKGLEQPRDIDDTSDYFAYVETSSCGSSEHDIARTNMSENKAVWKCPRGSPILQVELSPTMSRFSSSTMVKELTIDETVNIEMPESADTVASMEQSRVVASSVQETLQQNVDAEPVPLKRKKKDSGAPVGKNVVVLKSSDVTIGDNYVLVPNTIEMVRLKKKEKGQFLTNVQISSKMSQQDIRELLISLFPYLKDQRFYCASAEDNRTRLDFHGERRIWDGHLIKQKIKGNSSLYIFTDEGSLRRQDSSTNSKQPTLDEISVVPIEIRARVIEAELAYRDAVLEGNVKVCRARVLIIGQDRAGKTSLKKLLLGLPFNPDEPSTEVLEVNPSKFDFTVEQVVDWKAVDSNEDKHARPEDRSVARLVASNMAKEKTNKKQASPKKEKMKIDEEHAIEPTQLMSGVPQVLVDKLLSSVPTQGFSISSEDSVDGYQERRTPKPDITKSKELTPLVAEFLRREESQDGEGNDRETVLDIWDFAGQHLYYATHPVFSSDKASYSLVHNLSKNLDELTEPSVKHGGHTVPLKNTSHETNLDMLLSWLVSIHSIRLPSVDHDFINTCRSTLRCLPPPVLLVGTHADMVSAGDVEEAHAKMTSNLKGKAFQGDVLGRFYKVDNTKSSDSPGVRDIQLRVWDISSSGLDCFADLPVKWFNFEKTLKELATEKFFLTVSEIQNVARRDCFIEDDKQLDAMLSYYHDLGLIVRFRDTVVLDTQWLINLFKNLSTIRPYQEQDPLDRELWEKLETTGVLHKHLIDRVFKDNLQGNGNKSLQQSVLHMMEMYGFLVRFCPGNHSDTEATEETKYFVPAQLGKSVGDLWSLTPQESDPCPLVFTFCGGFVPHGLFPQLVLRLIARSSELKCVQAPKLYCNGAHIFLGQKSEFDLVLLCSKRGIKLVFKCYKNASTNREDLSTDSPAVKVRTLFEEELESLCRQWHCFGNVRYEICVVCLACTRSSNVQCERHKSASCSDQDCLHLLPITNVEPETLLTCPKQIGDVSRFTLTGLHKWYPFVKSEPVRNRARNGKLLDESWVLKMLDWIR